MSKLWSCVQSYRSRGSSELRPTARFAAMEIAPAELIEGNSAHPISGCVLPAILFLLALACPSFVQAASFTATLDRDSVVVGESATLTLRFEGGQPKAIPSPPAIPNLQISGRGTQFSTEIVNGQASSSISASFELNPTQPGEFTIPALTAQVGSEVLTSQPVKLVAVKSDASTNRPAEQLAFFRLALPKKEVFVGEVFAVEFQVYIREGVANAGRILDSFDAYGGSPIKAEGFTVLKTVHAQHRRMQSGNAIYNVATLVSVLTAAKTGPLDIGSMEVNITLQIPGANQRRDPFWDPFGFGQFEQRQVMLRAEPVTITSLPLPKENVPANFGGAIGSYTLAFTAGPTNVAVGDPITAKIQISGRGALDSLNLPEQPAWQDFKAYPPSAKVNTTDQLGIEGSKTFEQVLMPQKAEIKELPPISFSFFDPEKKTYRSLQAPGIKLVVRPTAAAPAPTVAAASRSQTEMPPPAQDIVPIKQRLGLMAQIRPPLVMQSWFLAAQAIPVLTLVSAIVLRKRAEQLANNPRLRRRRQVAQIVEDGLRQLRSLAAENKSDEFFGTLFHLLQEQLGERLDLPASAITEAVVDEYLRPRKVSEEILVRLQELFQICNQARYAPIKSSEELAALVTRLETSLRELQSLRL